MDHRPFSALDLLGGLRFDSVGSCAPEAAVLVEVDGKPECIRFYGIADRPPDRRPLIYLEGDALIRGDRFPGEIVAAEWYGQTSPEKLQSETAMLSVRFDRPVVNLARPGMYGSTGDHRQRRRPREVAVVNAALDVLKDRHQWNRMDLVGQSGGGHLVAALLARRNDIECATIASGNVAVKFRAKEMGLECDTTGYSDSVDPMDLVDDIAQHPPRLLQLLSDPDDQIVSYAAQAAFASALERAGIRIQHRSIVARDPFHHDLSEAAILAAAAYM
jgi:dienelactone hydrolase